MIYYLTYNEPFNGIFNSQVIDVVKHLRVEHQQEIRLISFVPIGFNLDLFKKTKSQLKSVEPNCIIIPTLPVQYGWKFNWLFLFLVLLFNKKGSIISREVLATYIAITCRKFKVVRKVCYDARGANYAQMKEYDIYSYNIKKEIYNLESFVLHNSDFRLAVSNNLVKYWCRTYNYQINKHVVIPCTISEKEIHWEISVEDIVSKKKHYGFTEEDIILVFSGSNYAWQSFDLITKFCESQLLNNPLVKIVFLSKEDEIIKNLQEKYNERVFCKWLSFNEVSSFLRMCDYGILLRVSDDTNNVASPTKFAEYLAAGLPVIISDNLEYCFLVEEKKCGFRVQNNLIKPISLQSTTIEEKINSIEIAKMFFLKKSDSNKTMYNIILNSISE